MNNSTSSEIDPGKDKLMSQQDGSPVMLAFYMTILVLGLIENSLVLVVIFSKKESKTANDIFIANLTVSDLTFIIFASPLSIYMYFVQQYASMFVCKFIFPMITVSFIVSIATVTSMGMQRCYAILNPFKPRIKRRTLIIWLAGTWFLSFLLVTPQIIVTKVSPTQSCYEEWPSQTYPKMYTVFLFTLQYVFPLVIISVSYIGIGMHVSKNNDSKTLGVNIQSSRRAKDERAVKRTIIIILILFLLCMLPNQVAYFLLDFGSLDQRRAARTFFKYVDIPTYFHCCVNPVIYGTVFRQFREGYVRYVSYILHFCFGKSCGNKSDHSSKDCFAEDLAQRRNRELKREERNQQVLIMEEDNDERLRHKQEQGFIDDGSSWNVVFETSL